MLNKSVATILKISVAQQLDQPGILGGHRRAVSVLKLCRGAFDQGFGLCELPSQCVQMACVGDEYRAGQAGFSELGSAA
jgi:hypothetical protein